MNHSDFKSWLDAYGRAWETQDAQAAAELFTDDATYQETPFDEPMRGRAAIAEYWSTNVAEQDQVRFGYEILATTEDKGIARWWTTFVDIASKAEVKLDGIFVVSLDAENRCDVFQEWWHAQANPAQ